MKLSDFVSVECVVVPLRARTLAEASEALLQCIEATSAIRDAARLRRRIDESRNEDVITVGGRAFLMHYRAEAVGALRVAIGVAAEPIVRGEQHDDPSARVVVLVVAPPREAARHLQLVRAFARLLARREVVDSIHSAPDATAVAAIAALDEFTLPEELTVRDLMTERPRTTTPEMPLREAAREMLSAGLSALPVVDEEGGLLGLLSERELMRHFMSTTLAAASARFTPPSAHGRRTVRDVMTRQVLCVAPEQSLADVAALMTNKDVERVPVVRGGRLVGFLTRGDIVRKLIAP
ncbi:MAG TPA: CBS domain-containing protein [Gemmatimonadaceae bacterium]|nr:CBS domain-containing protein [Gemmatimonadaceae bacterium]